MGSERQRDFGVDGWHRLGLFDATVVHSTRNLGAPLWINWRLQNAKIVDEQ